MIRQTSHFSGKKHDFQNCSIRVRAKKFSGETFSNECFFISFGLWLEKTWKLGKILAGLSKQHSICPEERLESNIFEKKCWKKYVFWYIIEAFETVAKKVLQGFQNCNNCPEEQSKEKPFSTEINLLFSQDSELTRFFH